MPKRKGETAISWYERAIVANSIAASDLDDLELSTEPVSQVLHRSVVRSTKAASTDLAAALDALLSERKAARG